jgi:hypothetical protein
VRAPRANDGPGVAAAPMPAGVAGAFSVFPGRVRARLLEVRDLIFETAARAKGSVR